jgi:pimeloyl-ACP methyl ester carboxylesterase
VIEFMKIIGPLTDPTAHGGRPEDAFHVVAPSLPGHGFSDKPTATGWDVPRIANAWIVLMRTPRLHPLGRPGRRLGLVGGNGHRRDEA